MARLPETRDVWRMGLMLALFVTLSPGLGRAASILLVDRSVHIVASYYDPVHGGTTITSSSRVDPVGYGRWTDSLTGGDVNPVTASQDSLVDSLELSGTGSVVKGDVRAETHYRVVFAVDGNTPYDFAVDNVYSISPGGLWAPQGQVKLDQVDPGNFSLVLDPIYSVRLGRFVPSGQGFPDFADSGVLAPGTYSLDYLLEYTASHNYGPDGSAGFSLLMIPEPGSLALIAMGLAILGLRRRSRPFG